MMGIPYNTKKPYKKLNECHECGEKFKRGETLAAGNVIKLKIYDDPWGEKPSTVKVHAVNDFVDGVGSCLEKLTDTGWASFRYFTCEQCQRTIIRQCLFNGWRSYVHTTEDGEEICVKCYQEQLLEEGIPLKAFTGHIPGDFFETGVLARAGYEVVENFDDVFIDGKNSVDRFTAKARELIKAGNKVAVDYERMGIGGGEGYVSLYARNRGE